MLPTQEEIVENIEKLDQLKTLIIKLKILCIKYTQPFFIKEDGTGVNLEAETNQALIDEYQAIKTEIQTFYAQLL